MEALNSMRSSRDLSRISQEGSPLEGQWQTVWHLPERQTLIHVCNVCNIVECSARCCIFMMRLAENLFLMDFNCLFSINSLLRPCSHVACSCAAWCEQWLQVVFQPIVISNETEPQQKKNCGWRKRIKECSVKNGRMSTYSWRQTVQHCA